MSEHGTEQHFWFGKWLSQEALDDELAGLDTHIAGTLVRPFPLEDLLTAAQRVADALTDQTGPYARLAALAAETTEPEEAARMLQSAAAALQRDALLARLRAELGKADPGQIERRYPQRQFEAWLPVGCVVHVTPSNVFVVAALGLIEGLLAGNVNIVKLSARDSAFAAVFAEALCAADPGGLLREYIAVLRLPSSETQRLQALFAHADAISAWGGEAAIEAIRRLAPQGVRLVTWGHKLSFGYVAAEVMADPDARADALQGFANDICRLDQQACSSPQTLFLECDEAALEAFADELAGHLARVSPAIPGQLPGTAEQAEITTVSSVARAEEALGLTRVIEAADGRWRIYVDTRPGLRPSPLFRSIWLKRMDRGQLVGTLRPMRAWLQTCGLACGLESLAPLTRGLFAAGVTRITRPGEMIDSYTGAPHDGVYALQQLAKRVSLDAPEPARAIGCLAQLEGRRPASPSSAPIMTKSDFQSLALAETPDLVFRSGGSSGNTVYSAFSWPDYHAQMAAAAHGLVAAGLEPERDCVMNLFLTGHAYGSFISLWSILENLGAKQVPMGMSNDFAGIADAVIQLGVNVLVGVPSHLTNLFEREGERLKGIVEKIFYGGEAMTRAQRERLQTHFGVRTVHSVAYGSNDSGAMGYQCPHCTGGEHHLMETVQQMEIVALDGDRPVADGETGRLLFTTSPMMRSQPRIERYEIGDTGRWLADPCPCGRLDRRFELQGRTGDVFRVAGPFFNARRFAAILDEHLGYAGLTQVHVLEEGTDAVLELWISEGHGVSRELAEKTLLEHYPEIGQCLSFGFAFRFRVRTVADTDFVRIAASGKLKPICDHRTH